MRDQESQVPAREIDPDRAIRSIYEGTARAVGERFFAALVKGLHEALDAEGAWATEIVSGTTRLRALAFWFDDGYVDDFEYDVRNTPCEPVVRENRLVHFPDRVIDLFPEDPDLERFNAVSYMGVPLATHDGRVLGHLAVLDSRPMPEDPRAVAVLRIFASRAAAELRRMQAANELAERDRRIRNLFAESQQLREQLQELRTSDSSATLAGDARQVRTVEELRRDERENILRALERAHWKVSGPGGAAELLGLKPSTLSSRMKALGIRRPNARR